MRIEGMRIYTADDPEIVCRGTRTYAPLHSPQYLSIFRTSYAVTKTLVASGDILMQAKKDAYSNHLRAIEMQLFHGKGGKGIHVTEETCDECDHTHMEELPYRNTYGYTEFIEAGGNINDEVILIGLRGRTLHWRRIYGLGDEDHMLFEFLSEVGLGLARNHEMSIVSYDENPFKLGWRE